MSKLTFQGIIEDISNKRCSDSQIEKLLEIFTKTLKPFAEISASKPWYDKAYYKDLTEFGGSKEADVEQFSLTIERKKSDERGMHFTGKFECDHKNLKVLAVLKN